MRIFYPTLAVLLSIILPSITYAESVNLSQALSELEKNSPRVQKAASSLEEASWKRVESYSGFLPTLNASGTYLTNKRFLLTDIQFQGSPTATSVPQVIPTTTYTVTAQMPLFDGFASTNNYRSASALERSAQNEFDWTRFSIQREITLQFYKSLGAKILKEVAENNIKTLEDHLKDVNYFKKAGVSTNYDVLRVEVQVSEARSELLNSVDNVEISRNKLGELLGNDIEVREPTGKLPVLDASLVKNLSVENMQSRGDLLALKNKTEAFDYQESAASRYFIPKVFLFGQYQYYNNINDQLSDTQAFREAYQVGITATWNLFDGMSSIAKSKQSVERRYQAEKTLRMTQIKAKQDFDFWKRKYIYFCSVYKSRLNDIQKSTESVRLAREGRKVGARTNTDLLDAESELYRAQAGAINSQIGSIEALINLEMTLGQKIYDFN